MTGGHTTPEERDLIVELFRRLRAADRPDMDREADTLIRRLAAEHPAALYLLVQTALVQDQALRNAQTRIAELERQTAQARPPASGSFLSGAAAVGPWGPWSGNDRRDVAPPPPPPPPPVYRDPGPWGYGAGPAAPPAGGGFLRTAMATAAGVAGGALLFEGLQHLIGANPGPFAQAGLGEFGAMPGPTEIYETVNNYYGNTPAAPDALPPADAAGDPGYDPGVQDAGWSEGDVGDPGDPGGDPGGLGDAGGFDDAM